MPPQRVQIIWQGDTGQTYSIELDASIREQHDSNALITDHPVEKGANISDHIRPEPKELTIEGVISNTPSFLPKDHVGAARLIQQDVTVVWDGLNNRTTVIAPGGRTFDSVVTGAPFNLLAKLPISTGLLGRIPIQMDQQAVSGRDVPGGSLTMTAQGFSEVFDRVRECDAEFLRIQEEGILCRVITTLRAYDSMALKSYPVTRDVNTGRVLKFSIVFKHLGSVQTKTEPVPKLPTKKKSKGSKTTEEHEGEGKQSSALYKVLH